MEQPLLREDDPYEGVAIWMKELAARKYVRSAELATERVADCAPLNMRPVSAPENPASLRPKHLIATAMLVLSFLQYYFLDVMVQINSMHSIVVFAPTIPHQRNASLMVEKLPRSVV